MKPMTAMFAGILLSAGMLLSTFPAMAQDVTLTRIAARVEQPTLLRGQFSQSKSVEGFSRPLQSAGRFVLAKEKGVLWLTEKPFPSSLSVTPRGLVADNGGSVRRINTTQEPGLAAINTLLLDLLGGDFLRLERDFSLTVTRENIDGWQIHLEPLNDPLTRVFAAIELTGNTRVEAVHLTERNGDRTEITFIEQSTEPALTDAEAAQLAQ